MAPSRGRISWTSKLGNNIDVWSCTESSLSRIVPKLTSHTTRCWSDTAERRHYYWYSSGVPFICRLMVRRLHPVQANELMASYRRHKTCRPINVTLILALGLPLSLRLFLALIFTLVFTRKVLFLIALTSIAPLIAHSLAVISPSRDPLLRFARAKELHMPFNYLFDLPSVILRSFFLPALAIPSS